ncbi:carph-isopro domain-containing protein [Aureimonas altamirensis]
MNHVSDIIDLLGGNAAVSRELGVKPSTVSEMKRRNSIPPKYWAGLLRVAAQSGRQDITADQLVHIHSPETHEVAP